MQGSTIAWLLVAVALFSVMRIVSQWRGLSRKRKAVDWDEQFIQSLRKAGVNTFEEQPVDFFFTLPTRAACEQLAFVLRPDGYTLDIKEDAETGALQPARAAQHATGHSRDAGADRAVQPAG